MSKYSNEQNLEVVKRAMERVMSQQTAGNMIGACKGDAQKWIKLYREHRPEGLSMKKGSYDGQFKVEVVEYMHSNHLSIREVSAKFSIPSHPTVARWERIYYEGG